MPVNSTTPVINHAPNGVTTVFAYPFKILNQSHMKVMLDGVAVVSGFTVSGVGNDAGGNVTFSVAPTGTKLTLYRELVIERTTDYQPSGDLLEATLDADQDSQTMMMQQLAEADARSLSLPIGTTGVSTELPTPAAGKPLGWAGDGGSIVNLEGLASAPVSEAMAPVVAAATVEAARAALGVDVPAIVNDFRLGAISGDPIQNVSASGTLFCTPFVGNRISLHDGSSWGIYITNEFSISLSGAGATIATTYDVFGFLTPLGIPALELHSWATSTSRATGLARDSGVLVKSGDVTRRYLGTIRTSTAAVEIEDSNACRHVWNYYNRTKRTMQNTAVGVSWTYTTATWRAVNGVGLPVSCVIGYEEGIELSYTVSCSNSTAGASMRAGVLIASDGAVPLRLSRGSNVAGGSADPVTLSGQVNLPHSVSIGYRYFALWEYSEAVGVTTWNDVASGLEVAKLQGSVMA